MEKRKKKVEKCSKSAVRIVIPHGNRNTMVLLMGMKER